MRQPDPNLSLQGGYDLSGLVERANRKDQPTPAASGSYVQNVTEADMNNLIELSNQVPVLLEVYGQGVEPQLGPVVESYQGKLALATLDAATSPQLVQALQIQGIPTVFAIIQGRPAPLFQGQAPEEQVRQVLDQVLELAAQAGVTGQLPAADQEAPAEEAEPEQKPLTPEHQKAFDALSANDLDGAEAAYRDALAKAPADQDAKAGLANVGLMKRLADQDAGQIRHAAAAAPTDINAQMLVADLDLAGGHLDDAFVRLLGLFPGADPEGKNTLRERMLEYFDIVGPTHPSVITARRQLTSLLY